MLFRSPQCFRHWLIREAHIRARESGIDSATDDVQLALDAGHRVRIVPGESRNIKITTAFDLAVARSYAEGIEPEGEGGFANA